MVINNIQSIINKSKKILSLFSLFFTLIICELPGEITKKYEQIKLLDDGQYFRHIDGGKLLICTYDSQYSDKINNKTEYISCIIISSSNSILYIIDRSGKDIFQYVIGDLPKFPSSFFNLLNFFPYLNNDKLCILITYINTNNYLGNAIYTYKYRLENFSGNITKINTFSDSSCLNGEIYLKIPIGNGVFVKSSKKLIFTFLDNGNISIYQNKIDDNSDPIYYSQKCDNCLDTNNTNNTGFLSDLNINPDYKTIFPCYKYHEHDTICYFINIDYKLFLYNKTFSGCEKNIKTYYFKNSSEYVITCENNNLISLFRIKSTTLDLIYSNIDINKCDKNSPNNYFLYYNNTIKKYHLICDCYNNNTFKYIKNITEPKNYYKKWYYKWFDYQLYIFTYRNVTDKPLDEILLNLFLFLEESIYLGQNYEIYSIYSNFSIFIKPLNSTTRKNLTDIDFFKCENIISINKTYWYLSLIIIEINNTYSESLSNKVEYKVFDENYDEVDLSVCENVNVSIKYALKENTLDTSEISNYRGFGINLFNISDVFFHELCRVYPDFKFDIILRDRVKYLYREYYICEKGCFFEDIDINYIYCNCSVDNNITTELDPIEFGEIPTKFPKYYEIIKCIWLVFSSDDKINNFGFYIITFMLGGHVPLWCYYLSTGTKPINDYISKEMTKYGYIAKRKKSKIIKVNNNKRKKSKVDKEGEKKDNNDNQNVDSPPPKKTKKIKEKKGQGKGKGKGKVENIENKGIIDSKKKGKKKKKKKVGTYIRSCYIINNTNNANNANIANNTNNDVLKSQKSKKKGKQKNKTTVSKKEKNSKINKLDNSNDLMKDKDSNNSLDPNLMETQNIDYLNNDEEQNYDDFDFLSIHLDRTIKNEPKKESNKILNNYTYEEAIEYDKRSLFRLTYIFLLSKNILLRIALLKSPFDSISVFGCGLIFIFSNDLFYNILFYNDEIVSKRFLTEENFFTFTFSTNLPNVFSSLFVVYAIVIIIYLIINNTKKLREIFIKEEEKLKKDANYTVSEERKKEILKELEDNLNTQNKKNYAFFIIEIIIMLIYWYYITAFCHVYSNSQVSWVMNTLFTIIFRYTLEFLLCFLFALIYQVSLSQKSQGLYNATLFIYNL